MVTTETKCVRIEPELYAQARKKLQGMDMTLSEFLRRSMKQFVETGILPDEKFASNVGKRHEKVERKRIVMPRGKARYPEFVASLQA